MIDELHDVRPAVEGLQVGALGVYSGLQEGALVKCSQRLEGVARNYERTNGRR